MSFAMYKILDIFVCNLNLCLNNEMCSFPPPVEAKRHKNSTLTTCF